MDTRMDLSITNYVTDLTEFFMLARLALVKLYASVLVTKRSISRGLMSIEKLGSGSGREGLLIFYPEVAGIS